MNICSHIQIVIKSVNEFYFVQVDTQTYIMWGHQIPHLLWSTTALRAFISLKHTCVCTYVHVGLLGVFLSMYSLKSKRNWVLFSDNFRSLQYSLQEGRPPYLTYDYGLMIIIHDLLSI